MSDAPPGYAGQLDDPGPWTGLVDIVLTRHGLGRSAERRMGRAGSYPTVIVGDVVVKLFPGFLGGPASYEAELAAYELLAAGDLPVPRLLAHGDVYEDGQRWRWPYIVVTAVDGVDLTSCKHALGSASWDHLAAWLGDVVKALHSIEHGRDWTRFRAFLGEQYGRASQRHRRWSALPPRMVDQMGRWLPDVDELVDASTAPVFVHADLHQDHILGILDGGTFTPTGVIDFGDSAFGPPMYELPALHFGTFHGDRSLLRRFLEVSGMPFSPRHALAFTLLFPFDVLSEITIPAEVGSLDQLAAWLYDVSPTPETGRDAHA